MTNQSKILLLSLLLVGCGQATAPSQPEFNKAAGGYEVRADFHRLASGDSWANWPDGLQENASDNGQSCERVSELSREPAIGRLADKPAVAIDAREYKQLTGTAPPKPEVTFYLLRGFSTTNSSARVKVTGNVVTVHSDALGGLFNLRRHPCIAVLDRTPSEVYTVAAYDL